MGRGPVRMAGMLTAGILAGILLFTVVSSPPGTGSYACPDCNVVVISVDMLRPDHMSLYGYTRNTTPHIDRMATDGAVFENAFAASSLTLVSVFSLMTGMFPGQHGITTANVDERGYADNVTMLAEVLRQEGYRTLGVTDGYYVKGDHGVDRGFDRFVEDEPALSMIGEKLASGGRPFFLYYEIHDLHPPYFVPDQYREAFDGVNTTFDRSALWLLANTVECSPGGPPANATIRRYFERGRFADVSVSAEDFMELAVQQGENASRCGASRGWTGPWTTYYYEQIEQRPSLQQHYETAYDAEIRAADARVGRLLDRLEREGVEEDTVIILTSAHGVELYEHRTWRNLFLYQEDIRIPLVLRAPGVSSGRHTELVQNIDIPATILDIVGITAPRFTSQAAGRSLVHALEGAFPRPFVLAEKPGDQIAFIEQATALKYYRFFGRDDRVYNLSRDPGERDAVTNQTVIRTLRHRFRETYERVVGRDPFGLERGVQPYVPG